MRCGSGRYINYIPYPVISGFMSGIGVIIILQLAQLVGHKPASGIVEAIRRIPEDFQMVNLAALGLGLATIALIYAVPRLTKAMPSTLVALIVVTIASLLLPVDVASIGTIPRGLPSLSLPDFELDKFMMILAPAIMLAIVGSLDSLLTSLVADAVIKSRHDSERELVGQGIGNLFAGLIDGLPGAGATMRTVVNVKSGGRGHLSGVIHALLLLAILLALGPLAEQIPMAVLAGILITVGLGILDLKGLKHVTHAPRGDAAVMIVVLFLTVFVDLMTAVAVGMVMAAMILLKRLSDIDPATHSPLRDIASHRPWIPPLEEPEEALDGVYVVELHGSLFFGNAGPLQPKLEGIELKAVAVVLHMGDVRYVDQSGVYMLADLVEGLHKNHIGCSSPRCGRSQWTSWSVWERRRGLIAPERIFAKVEDAIGSAAQHVRASSVPAGECAMEKGDL